MRCVVFDIGSVLSGGGVGMRWSMAFTTANVISNIPNGFLSRKPFSNMERVFCVKRTFLVERYGWKSAVEWARD